MCPDQTSSGASRAGGRTSSVSTSHWRTCGRYTTILGESRNFWRKANEDQTTWQGGPHDRNEGWTRSAPSCEGCAPNCPHARCSDLRLGKGEGRRPDGLAATHAAIGPDCEPLCQPFWHPDLRLGKWKVGCQGP